MNSYELSRNWFNYCFDNPEKVKPSHTAVYFFAIEHCNRLGWKEKFGFPSQMVMEAVGIKNWRTYSKVLNDLVDFGFIKMIEISKNQYSSNIIAIVKNTKAPTKALDKALQKHSTKQGQSTVSIDKQLNKEQVTTISVETFLLWFNKKKELKNGVQGKFKVLTFTDENNLKKLLSSYELSDFNYAIVNLFNSEWAKENNMITPSHFLRVENFNKYLNQEHKKQKLVIHPKDYLA
jgi:hypothetical protein